MILNRQLRDDSAGLPEGTVVVLLFCLIYIHDLKDNLHCNVKLFDYSTSLLILARNEVTPTRLLNINYALDIAMEHAF